MQRVHELIIAVGSSPMRRQVAHGGMVKVLSVMAAFLCGLASCADEQGPGPVATALIPDQVANDQPQDIGVEGHNFFLRIRARFDEPASSEVRGTFRVTLTPRAAGAPMQLEATRSTDSRLNFTLPAGLTPGTYDLTVTDLFGRTTSPVQLTVGADQGDAGAGGGGGAVGGGGGEVGGGGGSIGGGGGSIGGGGGAVGGGAGDSGTDAGAIDSGTDAGTVDGGTDAGRVDAGTDGGSAGDGGTDAGRVDAGTVVDAGSTPPLACLRVTPRSAIAGSSLQFDAFCSSDPDQSASTLTVRFAFGDGDGGYTSYVQNSQTVGHSYAAAGTYVATVQVLDDTGLFGFASLNLQAVPANGIIVVTTGIDEDTLGASPGTPGGMGLSLREAIKFAISSTTVPRIIRIGTGINSLVTLGGMPALPDDTVIVGNGELIDFNGASPGANSGCFVMGTRAKLLGLRITNCVNNAVRMSGTGAQLSDCVISSGPLGGASGIAVQGAQETVSNYDVSGFSGTAFFVQGISALMIGNRIHHSGTAVSATGTSDGLRVLRNFIYANAVDGFYANGGIAPPHQVWLNTFDSNVGSGVFTTGSTIDLQDNLFTRTGGFAVNGTTAALTVRSPNGFFSNPTGHFSAGNPTSGFFVADPRYRNPDAGDYRLGTSSLLRDKGTDLGIDLNGPELGNFNGTAVDLGADEAP